MLEDRAFAETWYAVCPRLANIVDIIVRGATGTSGDTGPAPPGLLPGSSGQDGTQNSADNPNEAASRSLLTTDPIMHLDEVSLCRCCQCLPCLNHASAQAGG